MWKKKTNSLSPFQVPKGDPLAEEHRLVSDFVEAAFESQGAYYFHFNKELNELPSGQILLDGNPEQSLRYLRAAVVQVRHWEDLSKKARGDGPTTKSIPDWEFSWGRRRQSDGVIRTLMRRKLPYERADLLTLMALFRESGDYLHIPIGATIRALQTYAAQSELDPELLENMKGLAADLRETRAAETRRLATAVEQIYSPPDSIAETGTEPSAAASESRPSPSPAPCGEPHVLDQLKELFNMLPHDGEQESTLIGPDRFPRHNASPFSEEHDWLSELFESLVGTVAYSNVQLQQQKAGKRLLKLQPEALGCVLLAASERSVNAVVGASTDYTQRQVWQSRHSTLTTVSELAKLEFAFDRNKLFDFLLYWSSCTSYRNPLSETQFSELITQVEHEAVRSPLSEGERYVLSLVRATCVRGPRFGIASDEISQLSALIGDGMEFFLAPGEFWSDEINAEFSKAGGAKRADWVALLKHAHTATSARPSAKWLKTASALIKKVGEKEVHNAIGRWLPLVSRGQSTVRVGGYTGDTRGTADTIHEENAAVLRGLLWTAPLLADAESLVRHIAAAGLSAFKKVPGVGPRAVKVGNATIYALSEIGTVEAVGQLSMMKARVKFIPAQKEIEKAFQKAAEALGLPCDQIEEMGVPTYGLEEVGVLRESLGDYRAELTVNGSTAALAWFDANGKPLKSVPARIKAEHQEELKELQQSLKDIQGMLPAQRDRIDSMFLAQRSWGIETWRERYLDHPLVGTIARRLIWCVDGTAAFFVDGKPIGIDGKPIEHGKTAEITLWHPVGRSIDQITAWRQFLEEREIVQPFKQAHREVYLLTDAELNTRRYSNRFAAHVIRQHQFHALCGTRGWRNRLRLMVDAAVPPASKLLPNWGLRAEYWIEGIGDDYGTDTNDAGSFLRLATDQVRFYRTGAAENLGHASGGGFENTAAGPGNDNINEPLPLDQIPPLVFSEIMRDVDLFVGVASVGNDPTWQDGGPEGRYREYWQNYSFGELSGTATTRKEVLDRLIPKLKIASRCTLSERFLVVRGDKRTYKIHLGSGNILMEPNDQYLCIVPDARARADKGDLFLPFEGDNVLSIILSKALLLAEDAKIKDQSIVRQIDAR
ncbi:MAG: DUF4132 domain-containing protein [Planctomycetaceae bacterium]